MSLFTQFAFAADCREDLVPGETLGGNFEKLMANEKLIGQQDPRLDQRKLLVPDGGLCVSTCGVNVLHSILAALRGNFATFARKSDEHVERIVTETEKAFSKDARYGMTLPQLASALRIIAAEFGVSLVIDEHFPGPGNDLTYKDLAAKPDELVVVSVRQGTRRDEPQYHAIVLTGTARDQVWYSDPNYPNTFGNVFVSNVIKSNFMTAKIKIPRSAEGGEHDGEVHHLLRIKIVRKSQLEQSKPAPALYAEQNSLVGKWVTVSGQGGDRAFYLRKIRDRRENLRDNFGYELWFKTFGQWSNSFYAFDEISNIRPLQSGLTPAGLCLLQDKKIRPDWQAAVQNHGGERLPDEITVLEYNEHDTENGFSGGSLTVTYRDRYNLPLPPEKIPAEFLRNYEILGN